MLKIADRVLSRFIKGREMEFRAKDIERILGIKKPRYEYIAGRIYIRPEVIEVEGTGRSHIYSFKNLLEFAFAHTANDLGLTPNRVKIMLAFLSRNPDLKDAGLFDPEKKISAALHYAVKEGRGFFRLSGTSLSEQAKCGFYADMGFEKMDEFLKYINNREYNIKIPMSEIEEIESLVFSQDLSDVDGYLTVNLGAIKGRIVKKISR